MNRKRCGWEQSNFIAIPAFGRTEWGKPSGAHISTRNLMDTGTKCYSLNRDTGNDNIILKVVFIVPNLNE
jgi:hypothetical protein